MNFAAIDTLNDVVLHVGSMASCEEAVRNCCYEAAQNDAAYDESDTPVITAIEDLNEKYRAMVDAVCAENDIDLETL